MLETVALAVAKSSPLSNRDRTTWLVIIVMEIYCFLVGNQRAPLNRNTVYWIIEGMIICMFSQRLRSLLSVSVGPNLQAL